jgi:hypothetical protein
MLAIDVPVPTAIRPPLPLPSVPAMHKTARILKAAAALSALLRRAGVPHAFHRNVMTAIVLDSPQSNVREECGCLSLSLLV